MKLDDIVINKSLLDKFTDSIMPSRLPFNQIDYSVFKEFLIGLEIKLHTTTAAYSMDEPYYEDDTGDVELVIDPKTKEMLNIININWWVYNTTGITKTWWDFQKNNNYPQNKSIYIQKIPKKNILEILNLLLS